MSHRNNLYEYTSGRWIINDALRQTERRRVFNVDGLRRLAAQSVGRSPDNIVDLEKLAEGGFNRTFLITMCDGFQMVARIPYPATVPKRFAVASEVATMDLLRSSELPIRILGYTGQRGRHRLEESEIISVVRQLVELESKMMSIAFPAGGSLYYTEDLKNMTRSPGIPLVDTPFCVGPDTRLPLWHGRRSQLNVDRGPYESAEAALVGAAGKELTYLEQFGGPLLPFQRVRREGYEYQEQSPLDHIENLNRYLRIASSLIPSNPALGRFCIRHPDLQQSNIIVSRLPDSTLRIVGLFDWQHTSILPAFLLAGIPERLQNYDDPVSQSMMHPSLPENLDDLDEIKQSHEKGLYLRRLVHYHYVKNTEECNALHYEALTDPMGILRGRLFCHAGDPWEGETLALRVALIEATKSWETLTGGGAPCPIVFDTVDVRKTMELDEALRIADETFEVSRNIIGFGPEGWVPTEYYEEAMERSKKLNVDALGAATSDEERAVILAHWPFDDMDEEKYM